MPDWRCIKCQSKGTVISYEAFKPLICRTCGTDKGLRFRGHDHDNCKIKGVKNSEKTVQRAQRAQRHFDTLTATPRGRSRSPTRDDRPFRSRSHHDSKTPGRNELSHNTSQDRVYTNIEHGTGHKLPPKPSFNNLPDDQPDDQITTSKWCLRHHGDDDHFFDTRPTIGEARITDTSIGVESGERAEIHVLRQSQLMMPPRNSIDIFCHADHLHEALRGAEACFANRDHIIMAILCGPRARKWRPQTLAAFQQVTSSLFIKLHTFIGIIRKQVRRQVENVVSFAIETGHEVFRWNMENLRRPALLGRLFDMELEDAFDDTVSASADTEVLFTGHIQKLVMECDILRTGIASATEEMKRSLAQSMWDHDDDDIVLAHIRKVFLAVLDTAKVIRDEEYWHGIQCIEWPSLGSIFSKVIDIDQVVLPFPDAEIRQYRSLVPTHYLITSCIEDQAAEAEEGELVEIKKEGD